MTQSRKIDIQALDNARLSADGTRVSLRLIDDSGQPVALTLPVTCLNALLGAAPRQLKAGDTYTVDGWSMDRMDGGDELLLTLRTVEAMWATFVLKPWQVDGMATIAAHARPSDRKATRVH